MTTTLGAIALPDDLVVVDEFDYEPVAQVIQRTLGGVNVIEESPLVSGRPITLGTEGQWITRATLQALRALADLAGQTHALNLRGDLYTVAFRRPAIAARPVIDYANPAAADFYTVQINLITV